MAVAENLRDAGLAIVVHAGAQRKQSADRELIDTWKLRTVTAL